MNERFNLRTLFVLCLVVFALMILSDLCFADEAENVEQAFANAEIKGTIGSYFEFTDRDATNSDFGWANSYLTIKFETQEWNRYKVAARFFAHGQL